MRNILILLVVFIAGFVTHYVFTTKKLDRLFHETKIQMKEDVAGALDKFEPLLKYNDIDTLGKASKVKKAFYVALLKTSEVKLSRPQFSSSDGNNVIAAMVAVKSSKFLTPEEITNGHRGLLVAAETMRVLLVKEGFLGDFDSYVYFLQKLREKNVVDFNAANLLDPLIAAAKKVDRYPIALRTVVYEAGGMMDHAFDRLGVKKGQTPGGCVVVTGQEGTESVGAMDAVILFDQIIAKVDRFMKDWKPAKAPMHLLRMAPIARHNSAMARFGYSIRAGKGIMLYDKKKGLVESDEQTAWSNYIIGMKQAFLDAVTRARRMDPSEMGRIQIPRSSFYALAMIEGRFAENFSGAATYLQTYRQLNPEDRINGPARKLRARLVFFY